MKAVQLCTSVLSLLNMCFVYNNMRTLFFFHCIQYCYMKDYVYLYANLVCVLICFIMKRRETAIQLRVQVELENTEAHCGLIVCLVDIFLGVLVPGLCGSRKRHGLNRRQYTGVRGHVHNCVIQGMRQKRLGVRLGCTRRCGWVECQRRRR
jgi:hypothetical protein